MLALAARSIALSTAVILGLLAMRPSSAPAAPVRCDPIASTAPPVCRPRPIDLVICLDTSGSMEGLIDSARARLWDIVNSLAGAKPTPELRVGLISYGSPSVSSAANGWLVKRTDLTTDLDSVYAQMMGIRTDGGDEFVGWALRRAIDWMNWSNDPAALKMIFIAGNESADQASEVFNFRYVAEDAQRRGISINAIYCGDRSAGVHERWDQVPACGGTYSAIDMRAGTVQISTPHDRLLLELNMKLNATYLPYGSAGPAGQQRQLAQDAAAEGVGVASAASRAAAKGSRLYQNSHWDLVDSWKDKKVSVAEIPEADLPTAMQAMSVAEREAYVAAQARTRAEVQTKIAEVSAARDKFLREERARAAGGKEGLDQAMESSIRAQAKARGFHFD